MDTLRSDKSEL